MTRKLTNLLILLLLTVTFPALAQRQTSPFAWRANVKMINATQGEIIIKVNIADGWHLYGTKLPNGGPKPTVFDLSQSKGIKLIGNIKPSVAPTSKVDNMFNLKLSYWTGAVTFRQKFKLLNANGAKVIGTVNYMGCNDKTCSPPAVFEISKPITVKR